jgi:uncharacterized Ntn-hydrolase superfamily protein
MTYSLVAHDPRTGQVGVAAMTAMVGVGKLVSHARSGIGAAASQAFLNPYLALDGLDRLAAGKGAVETLDRLIAVDPGAVGRQFALVDTGGGSAAWTGDEPDEWKGHRTGTTDEGGGWACQGNRLAGPQVLDSAVAVFLADPERPLVERLLASLDAGERAGGDTNGHRSATVLVMSTEAYPLWDLRIDHGEDPLRDLHRLYDVVDENLAWQIQKMPTRDNPLGGYDFDDHGACA